MSWPPVVVSAPGKVILHGEHAVVYGKAALATSLDLRCFVLLLPKDDGSVVLELRDIQLVKTWTVEELWRQCVDPTTGVTLDRLKQFAGIHSDGETPSVQSLATLAFLYLLAHIYKDKLRDLPGLYVSVVSRLPAGAGLGSSAAYSVCLAAGLMETLECISVTRQGAERAASDCCKTNEGGKGGSVDLPEVILAKLEEYGYNEPIPGPGRKLPMQLLETVNRWGFAAEELIHGTPSGIDNSVSTFGGAIKFQSGSITRLNRMPALRILLVNTKVPRSTKKMVAGVRERHDRYPHIIGPVLDSIEAISERAQKELEKLSGLKGSAELEKDTHQTLQELCVVNHHLLNAIGVGHTALDRVCAVAQQFGLSAKLTGGGGGGCALALIPPGFSQTKLAEVKAAFSEAGFDCWETVIGSQGVSRHYMTPVHA